MTCTLFGRYPFADFLPQSHESAATEIEKYIVTNHVEKIVWIPIGDSFSGTDLGAFPLFAGDLAKG